MSSYERGNEECEDEYYKRKNSEEVGIEADKGIEGQEGKSVRPLLPGQKSDNASLEDEDNAYSSIEASEVGRHGSDIKARALDKPSVTGFGVFVRREVFARYDLL